MNLFRMAWRNVWRNSRRSLVTIAAMALALWTELLYGGLISGMLGDMASDITQLEMGDVQITSPGWQSRPSLHETVDSASILPKLDAAGYRATARLQAGGLGASGQLSAGVSLLGVDPARDAKTLTLAQSVGEGQWLDAADDHGVVVGHGLARSLALKPGSELVVLSQGADGSMANDLFHVRGVLHTVSAGTDRAAVFLPEATFRELMVLPTGAHRIVLRIPPTMELDAAKAAIAAMAPGARVQTWKEVNPYMAQMLDAVKVQIRVVYFVMYVAVAILVLNAMLMALFERIREFGVLKALGYGPGQVFSLMMLEGCFQAGVAVVAGVVFALPPMYWLQTRGLDVGALSGMSMMGMTMPTVWRGNYTPDVLAVPIVMLFAIVIVAVIYPAAKAAWIRPVEAMQSQ
jgi:ABC-type lipoprotein release transport system permease subunit